MSFCEPFVLITIDLVPFECTVRTFIILQIILPSRLSYKSMELYNFEIHIHSGFFRLEHQEGDFSNCERNIFLSLFGRFNCYSYFIPSLSNHHIFRTIRQTSNLEILKKCYARTIRRTQNLRPFSYVKRCLL